MRKENIEVCHTIAKHYGNAQQVLVVEEMAELAQAICKTLRLTGGQPPRKSADEIRRNLIEEIGNVEIMLEQLKYIHDIKDSEVENSIASKLWRTLDGMKAERETVWE